MDCPCGSGAPYAACCGPFHEGREAAPTAEKLMRSRYSAYALCLPDYLWATHHPQKRPGSSAVLRAWAEQVEFERLEVLSTSQGGPEDPIGKVEFRAHYRDRATDRREVMHEVSRFRRFKGAWVYYDGRASKAGR